MKTYFRSKVKPLLFAASAAALFCLSAAGCENAAADIQLAEGAVQINLAAYSGPASPSSENAASAAGVSRPAHTPLYTILPSGLEYTVIFAANGDTKKLAIKSGDMEEKPTVTMAPGLWQVKATARNSDGDVVAQGNSEVQIIPGRTVRLNIALAPIEYSGNGTFIYDISNLSLKDYKTATMEIKNLGDNSTITDIDFLSDSTIKDTDDNGLSKVSNKAAKTDSDDEDEDKKDPVPDGTEYAAGFYQVTITLEKETIAMASLLAVNTEIVHIYEGSTTTFEFDASESKLNFAYRPKPALFFDHGTRITDADTDNWESRNTYYVASGQQAVLSPVIANAPPDAVYTWYIDKLPIEEKGEYLRYSFSGASTEVKVEMEVDAVTMASASTVVKTASYNPKSGGSKAKASTCIEFSPAPGQFVGLGNGFSNPVIVDLVNKKNAEVLAIVQNYMNEGDDVHGNPPKPDGSMFNNEETDGKVFSLGGWGGYYTVKFDHSVPNKDGPDLEILSNHHVAGMDEPGVVWVSQDINSDGKPNGIWYRLRGPQNKAKTRYAITYFRPEDAETAFWVDSNGRSGGFAYFSTAKGGFPYHITNPKGTFVTFSGVLIEDGSDTKGYVDSGATKFDISDAVNEAGESVNLTHIDFVKVQTAINKNGGGMGEYSTEAGVPKDLHF